MTLAWALATRAGGVALALMPLAVMPAGARTPGPPAARVGTIDSVAGPGFCPGTSRPDEASGEVGALAVDGTGRVYFDTGRPSEGVLGVVDPMGRASLVRTAVPRPPLADVAWSAGRLAGLATGGAMLAARTHVLLVRPDASLHVEAGTPATPGAEGAERPAVASGDGGPAADATFAAIRSIAVDEDENLYVADQADPADPADDSVRLRFVNRGDAPVTIYPGTPGAITVAPGAVDTIAGKRAGIAGAERIDTDATVDGPALDASIEGTPLVMAAAVDRLYIGTPGRSGAASPAGIAGMVRVLNLSGGAIFAHGVELGPATIARVAGGDQGGLAGDGGPARNMAMSAPRGLSVDADGNLLIADEANNRIRRIDPSGTVTTLAGTGGAGVAGGGAGGGFNGNDVVASLARLSRPTAVAAGPEGVVYISDSGNGQVRFVDRAGRIHAAPGNGLAASAICDPGTTPGLVQPGRPAAVVAAPGGESYVALANPAQVVRVDTSGQARVVAGSGRSSPPPTDAPAGDGPALEAALETGAGTLGPSLALALDQNAQLLYLGERARVRAVNLSTQVRRALGVDVAPGAIATVAGSGAEGHSGDGGPALGASLSNSIVALGVGPTGSLLIADGTRVRQVEAGGTITAVVGPSTPADPYGCCYVIHAMAVDAMGGVYVASRPGRIWFANPGDAPRTVHGVTVGPGEDRPVAGNGDVLYSGDEGPALDAGIVAPSAMVADAQGNLFVADALEGTVRKVDAAGIITTVGGTGGQGFNGDGLKARLTQLSFPTGLALDRCGDLLIADTNNDRVRRLSLNPTCDALPGPGGAGASSGGSAVKVGIGLVVGAIVAVAAFRFRARARSSQPPLAHPADIARSQDQPAPPVRSRKEP